MIILFDAIKYVPTHTRYEYMVKLLWNDKKLYMTKSKTRNEFDYNDYLYFILIYDE